MVTMSPSIFAIVPAHLLSSESAAPQMTAKAAAAINAVTNNLPMT
jgi:hypothetical protein